PEIEGVVDVANVSPWFDATARLKHPRGSQTTSITVASGTLTAVANTLPTPSDSAQDATAVAGDDEVVTSQEEQEISQGGTAEIKWRLSQAEVDEQEDISVKGKPAKKKRKKTKKKSKEIVIDDDELETDLKPVGASGSNLFKRHKPPPFRLSKSELLAYAQNGADDEDSTWRNGFLQVNRTKGPVMGAVRRPARAERSLRLWSLPTSSDRPSTLPPDPRLTERCNSPVCIDVFSVSENSWVKFEIDCLKASDPFEREILESLLACRTDTPGQNPAWLDCTDAPS
ncbi:hypothetical protein ARMGADRAFT_1093640, partial [Armillaria gallica]